MSSENRLALDYGDPYGTRTRVFAVRGRRPRPLDEGAGAESEGAICERMGLSSIQLQPDERHGSNRMVTAVVVSERIRHEIDGGQAAQT